MEKEINKMDKQTLLKSHICGFNDGEQECECFIKGLEAGQQYERKRIIEIVEQMKKRVFRWDYIEGVGEFKAGYNDCISDIIKKIKN